MSPPPSAIPHFLPYVPFSGQASPDDRNARPLTARAALLASKKDLSLFRNLWGGINPQRVVAHPPPPEEPEPGKPPKPPVEPEPGKPSKKVNSGASNSSQSGNSIRNPGRASSRRP